VRRTQNIPTIVFSCLGGALALCLAWCIFQRMRRRRTASPMVNAHRMQDSQPGGSVGSLPGKSASLPVPQPAAAGTESLSVQVPPGVEGGQIMQVHTPSGVMEVQVPPGLGPGATFQFLVASPSETHVVEMTKQDACSI